LVLIPGWNSLPDPGYSTKFFDFPIQMALHVGSPDWARCKNEIMVQIKLIAIKLADQQVKTALFD
jgi:hypothetical protein